MLEPLRRAPLLLLVGAQSFRAWPASDKPELLEEAAKHCPRQRVAGVATACGVRALAWAFVPIQKCAAAAAALSEFAVVAASPFAPSLEPAVVRVAVNAQSARS
eukprot:scaffold159456_cov28-Tisochrysis_lutea.AAC.2